MRLVSARWVIPIERPLIDEGAVALADDDTVLMVGPARICDNSPDAPEERALGALLPGLVNAHCHLELSAMAGAVPGGEGLVAWDRRAHESDGLDDATRTPPGRGGGSGGGGRAPRNRRDQGRQQHFEAVEGIANARLGESSSTSS